MTRVRRMASLHHRTVQRSGARAFSGSVRARVAPIEGPTRVGFAISRHTGNAVVRNRIRRRLRAIVETCALQPGFAVVLSANAKAAELPFEQLRADCQRVFARAGVAA